MDWAGTGVSLRFRRWRTIPDFPRISVPVGYYKDDTRDYNKGPTRGLDFAEMAPEKSRLGQRAKQDMIMTRRDDKEDKTYFRSDRLFCSNGQWFFVTREGEQGPYPKRDQAEAALERFIGEKVDLRHFQDTRDTETIETVSLTTIAKRVDDKGELVEIRRFENDADLLI